MQRVIRWTIIGAMATLLIVIILTLIAPSVFGRFYLKSGDVFVFPGIEGPEQAASLPENLATEWQAFSNGGESRLAILLTDADSAWLGLAHGLKAIGLPFIITDDPARALKHRVVMVYPLLAGSVLEADALGGLSTHVRNGGTLIGVNVLGGGLNQVFGFDSALASRQHTRVRFMPDHALTREFDVAEEQEIRIGLSGEAEKSLGTYEYLKPRNPPLATYENGAAAISFRSYGGGHAYALGFDPGLLMQKGHGYRLEGLAPSYVNGFEPTSDVILRLLRNIYRQGEPGAVSLHAVPWNRALSVNVTHDIDFNESLANAVDYAKMERELGVTGTFFIQTKYVRDWNDKVFFNDQSLRNLVALSRLEMEIASHSVSHSKIFSSFPLGDGTERYPDYVPFVFEERQAFGGTLLGELRVSKFLLDQLAETTPVLSFRAGYLENPFKLAQALAASGYRYDSTITANNALTHLPYRLNYDRGNTTELEAWEFPVTIEDERPPALPTRLDQALAVAQKISRYGGHYVILIHPNKKGDKLEFLRQLIVSLQPGAWFGSVAEFGQWWEARDAVDIDVKVTDQFLDISLQAPQTIEGLTLNLPPGAEFKHASPSIAATQAGTRLVLNEFQGPLQLRLAMEPPQ